MTLVLIRVCPLELHLVALENQKRLHHLWHSCVYLRLHILLVRAFVLMEVSRSMASPINHMLELRVAWW